MLFKSDVIGTKQSTVTSVDKKNSRSKHILCNSSKSIIYKYQFDGGIIKHSQQDVQKCDYIIEAVNEKVNNVFFIELKGKDITHALDQLSGTINLFIEPEICDEFLKVYQGSLNEYIVHLRIISTKIDKAKSILQPHERALLNMVKRLKSKYNIKFDSKELIIRQAGNISQVTDIV